MSERNGVAPCPFCGGDCDPTGWLSGDGVRGPECESCGATAASVEDWNRRAQPAEAGGAKPDAFEVARHSRRLVEQLRDQLAAMTAETDRLAAENKLLRGPEQTVVICEKGKPYTFMAKDPCRYSLCEVTYAAPVRALAAERDQLRAEVERLKSELFCRPFVC